MKVLCIEQLNIQAGIPVTSSSKLSVDIIYSLIGYKFVAVELTLLSHESGSPMPDSPLFTRETYSDNLQSKIKELCVNKYDVVLTFDLDVVVMCKDLPISNLVFCAMDVKPFLNELEIQTLSQPWIKVISFLPRLEEVHGLKINKKCHAPISYENADAELKPIKHEGEVIVFPVDARFRLDESIISMSIAKIRQNYPKALIKVCIFGIQVVYESDDRLIEFIGLQSFGEYLEVLMKSDLQVVYSVKYTLDLYPFYAMEIGIPTALISDPAFAKDYPYLPLEGVELLGINSVECQAERISNGDNYSNYLRSLARGFDEVAFVATFQSMFRSIANIDYREEYRDSIEVQLAKFAEAKAKMRQMAAEHKAKLESEANASQEGLGENPESK